MAYPRTQRMGSSRATMIKYNVLCKLPMSDLNITLQELHTVVHVRRAANLASTSSWCMRPIPLARTCVWGWWARPSQLAMCPTTSSGRFPCARKFAQQLNHVHNVWHSGTGRLATPIKGKALSLDYNTSDRILQWYYLQEPSSLHLHIYWLKFTTYRTQRWG